MIYNGKFVLTLFIHIEKRSFHLSRAMEASLLTSGLSPSEIENLRQQNQLPTNTQAVSEDLSLAMELSRREEEARLKRIREEEEELEKVFLHLYCQS